MGITVYETRTNDVVMTNEVMISTLVWCVISDSLAVKCSHALSLENNKYHVSRYQPAWMQFIL